jgi:CIC family chloride channel protein
VQAWNHGKTLLAFLAPDVNPKNIQALGRVLLHAAVVGLACGLVGAFFFAAMEFGQRVLLEELAGYRPLRAAGEAFAAGGGTTLFRPWVLVLLPGLGALLAGTLMRLAPETRGGGANAALRAYHEDAPVRARVIPVKLAATVLTVASGGSGGREGPTMHMGAALGALTARVLRLDARERRLLLVAGMAAGISAVFRTPLGAALLAVEILYRDELDSDALVPAVLASVISYSVVISIYGESTLFGRLPPHVFRPLHLPVYVVMAVFVSVVAVGFVRTLHAVQRLTARVPVPPWMHPALGGVALGILVVPVLVVVGHRLGVPGQGLGLLGGSYGAAQVAITGASWLPQGWTGVELLLVLCLAKLLATSLTVGTGGSAGDFAPSMIMGALAGGAFGQAARLALGDGTLEPGAFALVGMGTFYGGVARVPLAAVILVSEMAGSYDLLVPLMFSVGISFVLLHRHSLYEAQLPKRRKTSSQLHAVRVDPLHSMQVAALLDAGRAWCTLTPATPAAEVIQRAHQYPLQDVFPVVSGDGVLRGMVSGEALRSLAASRDDLGWALAADLMRPAVSVVASTSVWDAARLMLAQSSREAVVVDPSGKVLGLVDEADVFRAYLKAQAPR